MNSFAVQSTSSHFLLSLAERIVVGAPEVPIGKYTLRILEKASRSLGADFGAQVGAKIVSRELNVRQVLAKLILGEADAGITSTLRSACLILCSAPPRMLPCPAVHPASQVADAADCVSVADFGMIRRPAPSAAWRVIVESNNCSPLLPILIEGQHGGPSGLICLLGKRASFDSHVIPVRRLVATKWLDGRQSQPKRIIAAHGDAMNPQTRRAFETNRGGVSAS